MTERRLVTVLFTLAGGGAGVLLAHWAGVVSWLDAKLYLVGGVTVGFLGGKFLGWLSTRTSLNSDGNGPGAV